MAKATQISADEAIRRLREDDHVVLTDKRMPPEAEEGLIEAIREGTLLAGLTEDGQLAFTFNDGGGDGTDVGGMVAQQDDEAADARMISEAHAELQAELDAEDARYAEQESARVKTAAIQDGPSDIVALSGIVGTGSAELESGSPEYALQSLRLRIEAFLSGQPDVSDVQEVGVTAGYGFVYGLDLINTNGVSLTINLTP